ncbi:MAG: molybdenum cofactor biosynthesis protein MoaE [Saprospiraceae bacterium]
MNTDTQILENPLSVQACIDFVADDSAGGHVIFIGTVRNHTKGKEVLRLNFEAYVPMAQKEMQKICDKIREKWPHIMKISMHHRVGALAIGEIPIIIAVSAAHRAKPFEACQYAIDTLKKTVPIWKKEYFEDGEIWVAAHP